MFGDTRHIPEEWGKVQAGEARLHEGAPSCMAPPGQQVMQETARRVVPGPLTSRCQSAAVIELTCEPAATVVPRVTIAPGHGQR